MSEKELLYLEDALNQQKHFQKKCCQVASEMQDPQLKAFVEDLGAKSKKMFDDLFKLLNV